MDNFDHSQQSGSEDASRVLEDQATDSKSMEDNQNMPGAVSAEKNTAASRGTTVPAAQSIKHGLRIGTIGLILPEEVPTEVQLTPTLCVLPGAPQWVRGVTTVRGVAAPIFRVDPFFDHYSYGRGKRTTIVFQMGDSMAGFEIDDVPGRVLLSEDEKLINFPPLPASIQPFAKACYRTSEGLWLDWDIEGFFIAIADLSKHS